MVKYIRQYEKQPFTWVDGLISQKMAKEMREAFFTDVVFRDRGSRTPDYNEAVNVANLHEFDLKAWGYIVCPNHGENFENYFTSKKAEYSHVDGFYLDDTQILFETGGSISEYNQMIQTALEVLKAEGQGFIAEAVAGWNGACPDPSQLIVPDFDYYANPNHNYLTDIWPQCTTKGIYLWLYQAAPTIQQSQIQSIFNQAEQIANCKRVTTWQWYFAGETNASPEANSICFYPELIEDVKAENKGFMGSLQTVVKLESHEIGPASQFDKRALANGLEIYVIKRTYSRDDEYGNPIFTEAASTVKGFMKLEGREKTIAPGNVSLSKATFLIGLSSVVLKEDYELSYGDRRWKIVAINPRRSHLEITAEAKVE